MGPPSTGIEVSTPAVEGAIPPHIRRFVVLAIYSIAIGLLAFDKLTQDIREAAMFWCVGLLAILELPAREEWRKDGSARRGLLFTVIGVVATIALAEGVRLLVDREGISRNKAFKAMKHERALVPLITSLWLFAPVGLQWLEWLKSKGLRAKPDATAIIAGLSTILLGWSFITSISSIHPARSFEDFRTEIGVYVPLFLYWLLYASRDESMVRAVQRAAVIMMMVATLIGAAAVTAYVALPASSTGFLTSGTDEFDPIIKVEPHYSGGTQWRLCATFGHHNRMSYFSAMATLVFLFAAVRGTKWLYRIAFAIFAFLAVVNLQATMGRGALLALLAAVFLCSVLALGRKGLLLFLLIPIAYFLLPERQKERITSLFEKKTYVSQYSTVAQRFRFWDTATSLIADNPLFGVGYGWENMQFQMEKRSAEQGYHMGFNHPHNVWLQLAAESGLPGVAIFLVFSIVRWALMLWLWRRRREFDSPIRWMVLLWIGLEIYMQVYCLSNLPLRRSLGLLTWGVWAFGSADLLKAARGLVSKD